MGCEYVSTESTAMADPVVQLGDEKSTDSLLQSYADAGDLAVVSVGYRHAPEDPFPKGPQDCIDGAEYLIKNSEAQYGCPVRFIGGEVCE